MLKKLFVDIIVLPTLALCAVLPNILDNDDILQGSVVSPTLSYAVNSSTTYGNGSVGNTLRYRCDWIRYGRDIKVKSCSKVFSYLKVDDAEMIFAERSSVQTHDVNLPLRTTSSKCQYILSLLHVTLGKRKKAKPFLGLTEGGN